ncbi:Flavodoxin/nitric oxide synthase [Pseudovibrio sp. FO-BEG1]|uniref:flavodoxin family protein n=1 Tax=Pseudovibrio sp. (strain FO-BEG1) TaxID=911045 RepID=UPI000238C81D|nr:flavodoxin family protein [Pseudovibrio sp. FO-BEG1]AEV35511.1 Flavodoxin/nitric oxide synthase [Pseudovibrio sp. FO-BEG1]
MSKDILVAIAFFSANGHTEALAHAIARGARENGVTVTFVPVSEYEDTDWGTLEAADAIVFGTPTYMGGVAAPFKFFMDASATVWYKQGWINKIAGGFSVSGSMSGDRLNVFLQMATFAAQHGMIWVSLGMPPGNNYSFGSNDDLNRLGVYYGAAAQANMDEGPEVAPPQSDRDTAFAYGARIAKATRRWVEGGHNQPQQSKGKSPLH